MDEDEYRRERIIMEVIVDCYDDEEISYAWEAYMENGLMFPFKARIINENSNKISVGEIVNVTDDLNYFDIEGTVVWLKDRADTINELEVQWNDEEFSMDIEDLEPLDKTIPTIEAIKDWNFWIEKY